MKLILSTGTFIKRNAFIIKSLFNQVVAMSSERTTVFVRHLDKDDFMKISFEYKYPDYPAHNFTFQRSKTEKLEVALARIKTKIASTVFQSNAKRKRKKVTEDIDKLIPSLNIILHKNGVNLPEDIENKQAWRPDTKMTINEVSYQITVNPPSVNHISLPKCILTNFPVYPKVCLDFCSFEDCIFSWYRCTSNSNVKDGKENRTLISKGFLYEAQDADAGHRLKVSCVPCCKDVQGMEESVISLNNVLSGPKHCPFEDRHHKTKDFTKSDSFRFVSYNILADCYADTDTARNALFPYCPAEFLSLDYRKALYLKEISGYNADIVCLQEVDQTVFQNDLVPFLATVGLNGVFNTKAGNTGEGLACFYRQSKFKLVESHSITLTDALKTEPVLQHLHAKLNQNEKLIERFLNRSQALQVTLFKSLEQPSKQVLVGNTHLYFHPDSDNIRLLQAACCLFYLESCLQKYHQEDPSSCTSLVFCGDFNSCPKTAGVYKLATEGFLPHTCVDWESNEEEKVEGMDLKHGLQLGSACGTPLYTNYTTGFQGCLDYIFYDISSLQVAQVVPLPSHEQVIEHIALPNKVFPSDHIALVSTLQWK